MLWLLYLVSFIIGLLTDIVWTKCVRAIGENNPFWAANWSLFSHMIGIIATLIIVEKDLIGIIFYVIGGYIGTYLTVWLYSDADTNETRLL